MEDFEQDVSTLMQQFKALPGGAQHSGILADFQSRWEQSREKLAIKLHRRVV